jgi:CubicO group peptidase (beta-lactamase class C family)
MRSLMLLTCAALALAQPRDHKEITLDQKVLDRYVGHYAMTPSVIMTVTTDGGHIFTQLTGQGKVEIFPEGEHDFFLKVVDAQITFNDSGLVLHQNGRNVPARRIVQLTAENVAQPAAQIDDMVRGAFAVRPVGSVTVGIVSGKDLVWTKTYGEADMEKHVKADKDTIYRIGSITKMFTALMLEQLVDAGKVHLSDQVEKYFPELKSVTGRLPDAPPITLVQLATHTSGLAREPENADAYASGGPPSAWEKSLLSALPHTRYQFEPGTRFFYSNMGFAILGAALSRAAGQPYMEYVPKHILEPLGMTHSGLERTDAMMAHLAKGYMVSPKGVDSDEPLKEHEGRGYKMPNGAMYTTVGDLARFASFLMGEGPAGVLKPAALEHWLMNSLVPSTMNLDSGYGPGFEVVRRENYISFGHGGAVAGYAAEMSINRQRGIAVIVLSSSLGTPLNPTNMGHRILDLLSK